MQELQPEPLGSGCSSHGCPLRAARARAARLREARVTARTVQRLTVPSAGGAPKRILSSSVPWSRLGLRTGRRVGFPHARTGEKCFVWVRVGGAGSRHQRPCISAHASGGDRIHHTAAHRSIGSTMDAVGRGYSPGTHPRRQKNVSSAWVQETAAAQRVWVRARTFVHPAHQVFSTADRRRPIQPAKLSIASHAVCYAGSPQPTSIPHRRKAAS